MPYCCQCGKPVTPADSFCAHCGGRQPDAKPSSGDPVSNLSPRNASLLCYIPLVGWIVAIILLASDRFKNDRGVRFHAFQGLYLFVTYLIATWAVAPMLGFPSEALEDSLELIFKAAVFCVWIFMIIKTSQNETFRLPLLGQLADRSVAEQR